MSVKLSDLRVVDSEDGDYVTIDRVSEPASTADLVAALIAEGGETYVVDSLEFDQPALAAGRYLVFPIPAEKETTG